MTQFLKRLWPEEEAQNLPEYALLLFLISLTAVTAMGGLASKINHAYSDASTRVVAASSAASLAGGGSVFGTSTPTHFASAFKDDNTANTH